MQDNFTSSYTGFVETHQGGDQPRKSRSSFPKKPGIGTVTIIRPLVIITIQSCLEELHKHNKHNYYDRLFFLLDIKPELRVALYLRVKNYT